MSMFSSLIKRNIFSSWFALLVLGSLFLYQCSPRTGETVQLPDENGQAESEEESVIDARCATFESIPRGDRYIESYVLYRDFLRAGDMEEAFGYWRQVFKNTPAADGQRWTVFSDGIRFYEWKLQGEDNENKRAEHIDKILELYDLIGICYPQQFAFSQGRKAFDLYYNYRGHTSDKAIYDIFQTSMDAFEDDVQAFIINPYTALLVRLFVDGEIDTIEAQQTAMKILAVVDLYGDVEDDAWSVVKTYAPQRLADLEVVSGFYPCEYYLDNYSDLYYDDPENCENIQLVLSRLLWGNCSEDLEIITQLRASIDEHCQIPVTASSLVRNAYEAMREGRFRASINYFEQAIAEEVDVLKKAEYSLTVGKIYYSHLRDFPKAREAALKAAGFRSNWGEPYILIGKLYASSGPLCGPGTGWDSQVVTWVAIDAWERAKQLDSSVRGEANQLIATYERYMPSRADIFQRNVNEGDDYFVACWIQRSTTIRAAVN